LRNLKAEPLRIGILGCGSFAERRILTAAPQVDTVKIVCVQKRDLNEAKKAAAKFGIPHAVATREELIRHAEVEAIWIATPNHMHEEDAIACAKVGKPTLCEKPLAPTSAAVERMVNAFKEADVPFFVGHSLRFRPAVRIAQKFLQDQALGKLMCLRIFASIPVPKDNWRHKKEFGGGVLQDLGIHLIDLIQFISGEDIESIQATAQFDEVDETVAALCRLSNGAIAYFECSFEQPFYTGFEVIGSKSRLVSRNSLRQTPDPIETLCHIREDDSQLYFPLKASNVYEEELKHFAEAATGLTPSIISAEIGLKNQKILETISSLI